MVNILVIECKEEDRILQEVVDCIFKKTQCQITNLQSPPHILTFPNLEIHLKE